MGKIKEQRYRVHKKIGTKLDTVNEKPLETEPRPEKNVLPLVLPNITDNPFYGLDIDINKVTKPKKVHFDTCSVSGKSHRELKKDEQHLPKKEKKKRRHDRFLEKLEITYERKTKKKKQQQPNKKKIDMEPLLVSLPSATSISKPVKPKIPVVRQAMKLKKRLKHDLSDIKHFRSVLDDSVFRKNPAVAIKEFLIQKIAEKRPDLQLKPAI